MNILFNLGLDFLDTRFKFLQTGLAGRIFDKKEVDLLPYYR
jgi:hypothetical protein